MRTVSRRQFLSLTGTATAGVLFLDTVRWPVAHAVTPVAEPLARLLAGNKRFVASRLAHPNRGAQRRTAVARGQRPFAALLSCADSRVPPEIVFEQGLGDLFVVRVAGNIADRPAIGSLEYAATVLEVPLVLVLGHSRCGAVDAALKAAPGADLSPGLTSLVEAIRPAVAVTKDRPGDALANAIRANITHVVGQLKSAPPTLARLSTDGKVRIVGAHYDLETGVVEVLA
jgi:carbonic anhydrase